MHLAPQPFRQKRSHICSKLAAAVHLAVAMNGGGVAIEPARPTEELCSNPIPTQPRMFGAATATTEQLVLIMLGTLAFLYFARPVVLPIGFAVVAGMALKPFIRWSSRLHIPPALAAAVVLILFVSAVVIGFVQLGRPAVEWMKKAPEHMAQFEQRLQKIFRPAVKISELASSLKNIGAGGQESTNTPAVEVKDTHAAGAFFSWTGSLLASVGETLVLLYLMLASGDLFLQKLVRVMPTWNDKRRAVEISDEIQQNISNYLFSVSLVNVGLGIAVSGGLYLLGVPNPGTWGMLAALLNFVPYFGPAAGIILLGIVGLLSFDTLWKGLMPPAWYLLLHFIEANFITPLLLGRRLTLNPVVIFISLIFWTWLWGVGGALLSVPILVIMKAVCDRVEALSPVSEFLAS